MAFLPMIFNNSGGGGITVHPVLIGQYTSSSASAVTRTLTDSIANYKYLWFSMSPITSDSVWLQNTLAYSGYSFVDIDYFRNNALTLRYTTSPSGTLTARTMTLTYVSDTTFTSQAATSDSRDLYVYGIKDMPSWQDAPCASGEFTYSTSEKTTIDLGFRPKYLMLRRGTSPTVVDTMYVYDERFSTINFFLTGTGTYLQSIALGSSTSSRIYSINNNGFTANADASGRKGYYFAIG